MWLDAAAAHARPPAGIAAADPSFLGWIGGRLRLDRVGPLTLDLSAYGGRSVESAGGTWLNGAVAVQGTRWLGSVLAGGRAELFGLDYREPFAYHAYGLSLTPQLSRTIGAVTVRVRTELTRGRWSLGAAAEPAADSTAPAFRLVTDGPLAVTGASLTVGRSIGAVWLEGSVEAYDARNGDADGGYAALGVSAGFPLGPADALIGLARWSTPTGAELGFSGTVSLGLSERLVGFATVEKTATDPLYGSPGSVTTSLGVSWRMASRRLAKSVPVVEVAESVDRGRRVRFRLPADVAERVALAGDFTGWSPRPMNRSGDVWELELVLGPGLHHFVFVLDGDRWYVPDDAPGIVDDGWGRRNASLVVVDEA